VPTFHFVILVICSIGTLAPSFHPTDSPKNVNSIDIIFATYWFYPAKTKALLPVDQKCIETRMAHQEERFDIHSNNTTCSLFFT